MTRLRSDPTCLGTFIQTDHAHYCPGQPVRIRVVSITPEGRPNPSPVSISVMVSPVSGGGGGVRTAPGEPLHHLHLCSPVLTCAHLGQDPRANLLRRWQQQDAVNGVVSVEFQLSDSPPTGPWVILANVTVSVCV